MTKRILPLLTVALLLTVAYLAWAQTSTAPPYSPARKAGATLFVSGQLAKTPTGQDVRTSVEAEARQVMENLGRILKENGCGFDDVVNANVYLADIADYQTVNKVYASYFHGRFPARACVGGMSLVQGFKVEISCVAYKEGN
jgi:2-iminobutanoate/2-iminopropanoate deaminase